MRQKVALMALLGVVNLYAFSLNGTAEIKSPLSVEFGLEDKVSKNLIGTLSDKKIISCQPALNGIVKFRDQSLLLFTKDMHAGLDYSCKLENGSTASFATKEFELTKIEKISDSKYIVKFNDEVNIEAIKNIAVKDAKFKAIELSNNSFELNLDKNLSNPVFDFGEKFESKFGATLSGETIVNFADEISEESVNINDNAKSLEIPEIYPVSLDNGILGFRIYLKNWLDDDINLKKFINIKGVKNFSISDVKYSDNYEENSELSEYYYYIDITSDDFKPQNSYEITIKPGFGDDRNVVREESSYEVVAGNFTPFANFINNEPYISSVGEIGIRSANLAELNVSVERLAEQNFRFFLNFNYDSENLSSFSTQVAQKSYKLDGALNEIALNKIKLDFAGAGDGVYKINLNYGKNKSVSKVVYLSDIAVNVKLGKDEIFVFANRLGENTMLPNANVKIYGVKNEEIAIGATNDEGVFKFNKKDIHKIASSVVVSLGKEQNFLIIQENEALNDAQFISQNPSDTIDVYTHFASNIIRPNESLQGAIYLRDRDFKPLKNMPVKIKFIDPQGKSSSEISQNTNDAGMINFEKEILSDLSGRFNMQVIYASKVISSVPFYVESFVPNRIKNEIVLESEKFFKNDLLRANLISNYLFGGAASELDGNLQVDFFDDEYKNSEYKEYKFKNDTIKASSYPGYVSDFALSKDGKSSHIIDLSFSTKNAPSIIRGVINFNVNDDGKNVSEAKSFTLYPYKDMVGIAASTTFAEPNEDVKLRTVVLEMSSQKAVKSNLKFDVKRVSWQYQRDANGYIKWIRTLEDIDSFYKSSGEFGYKFTQSGSYVITATNLVSGASTSLDIDVSGYNYSTLAPTKELSKSQIKLNKSVYKRGDELSADISSAIKEGIALVTLEDAGVKAYKVVKIKNNSANVKFKLDFDFSGLYVSANIYRMTDAGLTPFRTYGKVYANGDKSSRKIDLSLDAPKVAKSDENIKISLKTKPKAYVNLFITDVGVLDITSQKPADPLKFFDKILPDGVFDYDIYNRLTNYKVEGKILNFGGDMTAMAMEAKMAKHASPVDSKNVKTFANLISLQADDKGEISYEFKTPNGFNSAVRVDVVANNESGMNAVSSEILIKDEVIIKPSVVVYLLKGDELNANLRLINTTNEDKNLTIKVASSKNLSIKTKENANLKPLENKAFTFKISALEAGAAEYNVTISDKNSSKTVQSLLDVVNPYTISTYAKSSVFDKESMISLPKGFHNVSIDASSSVSSVLLAASKNLVEYPYGCAEQRSSRLLALLNLKPKDELEKNDQKRFITHGMSELIKMQKPDGSFGYWSDLGYTNAFANIFTTDVLLDLEEAGYDIGKRVKQSAVNSMAKYVNSDLEALYSLYVSARANMVDKSLLNKIYDDKAYNTTALNKYLMAAALKLSGLNDEAKVALKDIKKAQAADYSKDYSSFGSKMRDNAFILYLHAKYFEKNDYSDDLANFLITNLNELSSTQERAFTLRALNAYFGKDSGEKNNKFKLSYNGSSKEFDGLLSVSFTTKDGNFTITPLGKNKLYATILSYAYVPLEIKHKIEPKELDIYRTFVDEKGKELGLDSLKVNDVIYSKVVINSKTMVRNGVINEVVSSCFEPINENLSGFNKSFKDSIELEYQSIKDDRVLSFYTLDSDKREAVLYTPYRVRLSGKCSLGAVTTENMYNERQNDYDLAQRSFTVK
ncbi:alpha-2-macroglobulin family protein [Campylobacter concisus]|uniref:Alpha-2-macroglobulin n=1 Tax=Campylobacter concisus ATCC 51562 TaxID=1242969 RepID=U2F5Z1_9BACT|nr:alpha-2-macroglobulin [Campylobacter concisus]ERJ25662.1 Alpha-2-macroglobulin [Campylobacter concisus ATCC 51562]